LINFLQEELQKEALAQRFSTLSKHASARTPISLEVRLPDGLHDWIDLIPDKQAFWYQAQTAQETFRLGLGQAFQVSSAGNNRLVSLDHAFGGLCRHWRSEGEALAFAGFAFDPNEVGLFPNALLTIPAMVLECCKGKSRAILTAPASCFAAAQTDWLKSLRAAPPAIAPSHLLTRPPSNADKQAWRTRVHAALSEIAHGHLDKLVLSRHRRATAVHPFSEHQILRHLLAHQPEALTYAWSNGRQTFLGATPERLVSLRQGQVSADALAGTAWLDSRPLNDVKNQREQSFVTQAVVEALRPHSISPPRVQAPQTIVAGKLLHLRSQIEIHAKPETTLFELAQALHPTPAVGGYPPKAAENWLRSHAELRAGWYSGGIGLLDTAGNGEFFVALRCALLDGQHALLQAGAGIVAGSEAAQEFAETEAKMSTLLDALLDCKESRRFA
jgi:isochorismate synthase